MLLKLTFFRAPPSRVPLERVQRFLLADDKSIRFMCALASPAYTQTVLQQDFIFIFGNFSLAQIYLRRLPTRRTMKKFLLKTNIKNHFYIIVKFGVCIRRKRDWKLIGRKAA